MLGHGQGIGARGGQPPRDLAMQPDPHAGRNVTIDGLPDQVVTEARHVCVVDEGARREEDIQIGRYLDDGSLGHLR